MSFNPYKPSIIYVTQASSADPDQTPRVAALFWIWTVCWQLFYFQNLNQHKKQQPSIGSGIVQLISIGTSIRLKRVNKTEELEVRKQNK